MDNRQITRRTFHAISGLAVCAPSVLADTRDEQGDSGLVGPLLGHVDASSAIVWARVLQPGSYKVTVNPANGIAAPLSAIADAVESTDLTAHWHFKDLLPDTRYLYELIDPTGRSLAANHFRTPAEPDAPARVSLAFGSCAREDSGSRAVWRCMEKENVDGVVLMGDTPYIDDTQLATQRRRYREFASVPEYQHLLGSRPHWATWDDHDFGTNDCDGTQIGKENSRRAFTEYRALPTFGDGTDGIYTSFRRGPLEVFLLDTRWFSATAPSFADSTQTTLLGDAQWEWLQAGLRASTAPFKVLACGFIWDRKANKEKDHWETYHYERQAVFDFIRRERIGGVVLFGGDIHVTRVLRYPAEVTVGYPLYQFISSPIHAKVIPSLDSPHPALLHSAVESNTFLKLTADSIQTPPTLTAAFINRNGARLFDTTELSTDELSA